MHIWPALLLATVPLPLCWGQGQDLASDPLPALAASRGLAEGAHLRLSGDVGNELERTPFTLEFDSSGRFFADFTRFSLRDASFDGRTARGRDAAGYAHELFGWERDAALLFHGFLCGNWTGEVAPWEVEPVPQETLVDTLEFRVTAGERPLDARLWVDTATQLPRRLALTTYGKESALEFGDWRHAAVGRFPGEVRIEINGVTIGELRFTGLEVIAEGSSVRPSALFTIEDERSDDFTFAESEPRELEVRVLKSGHQFVRAAVDGAEPGWFLFDSGSPGSKLDEAVARQLDLDLVLDGLVATGAGGSAEFRMWRARELQVGPLRMHEPLIGSMDLSGLGRSFGLELAGILGTDVMSWGIWRIDITAGEIEVHPPGELDPEGATWIPARHHAGHLVVQASFEGHEGWFTHDTGGGGSGVVFNRPTIERLDLLNGRKTTRSSVFGTGGSATVRKGRIETFTFGGRKWRNVIALFPQKEGTWEDPHVDGLIGIRFMRPYRVVLDFPGRRIGLQER